MKKLILIIMGLLLASCHSSRMPEDGLNPIVKKVHQEIVGHNLKTKAYDSPRYDCTNISTQIIDKLHKLGIAAEMHGIGGRFYNHAMVYIVKTGYIIDSTSLKVFPPFIDQLTGKPRLDSAYMFKATWKDLQILKDPIKCLTWKPKKKVSDQMLREGIRNHKEWIYE